MCPIIRNPEPMTFLHILILPTETFVIPYPEVTLKVSEPIFDQRH